jgi:DNA-binding NarL/FixJ family response regulator
MHTLPRSGSPGPRRDKQSHGFKSHPGPRRKTSLSKLRYALIVDDHPLVGRGIAELLKTYELLDATHNVGDAAGALDIAALLGSPAIAVVDFWLNDGSSVGFIAQLRAQHPQTAVLVISGDASAEVQAKARHIGAQGFIDKQASADTFGQAILAVLGGMTYFDAESTAKNSAIRPHDVLVTAAELGLSPRQGQILELVLQGLPNKRIAQSLSLSESTVKEHVTGILQRLGVSNRVKVITKLRGRRLSA